MNNNTSPSTLIILDFDETIMYKDGTTDDLSVLDSLHECGVSLCIASRNDRYTVEEKLSSLSKLSLFHLIAADFRPKVIQVKHTLLELKQQGIEFERILFVDDFITNIELMRHHMPNVESYQFGKDITSLSDLLSIVRAK